MSSGSVAGCGTYEELQHQGIDFGAYSGQNQEEVVGAGTSWAQSRRIVPGPAEKLKKEREVNEKSCLLLDDSNETCSESQEDEDMGFGPVKGSTLWFYISAGAGYGSWNLIAIIALCLLTQALNNGGDYWIKYW
jgi:hypothetical protein